MSVFRRWVRVTYWHVFLLVATAAFAADFFVTNINDSGPGSLRQAIEDVNSNGTASNRILFAIPNPGVQTISLSSDPPIIQRPLEIDGTSQGDTSSGPLIEIIKSGDAAYGLSSTQDLVLRRLAIGGFNYGVTLSGGGSLFGNYLGLRADGSTVLPNGGGVRDNAPPFTAPATITIGGLGPGEANVISGNRSRGIGVRSPSSIIGNLIGVAADGSTPLPNGVVGIEAENITLISQNTIASHIWYGVSVGNFSRRVRISANSMFSNRLEGIHLSSPVSNDGQTAPGISAAYSYPTGTRVVGSLNSVPNEAFIVELFSNPVSERQGRTYLGQVTVNTDAGGAATFDTTLPASVTPGHFVTSTAIRDANGNTSEFSTDALVVAPGEISFDSAGFVVSESGGVANVTLTRAGGSDGAVDVDLAVTGGSATTGVDYIAPGPLVSFADGVTTATVAVSITPDLLDEANETVTFAISNPTNGGILGTQTTTTLTINDDDTAGIDVTPATVTTSEAGGTDSFTVVLESQPAADVSIGITSSDTGEGTVSSALLTFTPANWNVGQTITVTGVNDAIADGDVVYTIVTAAATSADATFNGLNAADVVATNTDDDTAGISVAPATIATTEAGGTDAFTVVLQSQPTADVSIGISSSDTTEGTVSAGLLTFTPVNWNVGQIITVTGVDDAVDDGDVGYTIVTAAATSADAIYNGLDPANVAATNTDDDGAGITVTPATVTTTEAGGTDSFTVVLESEPAADVTIALASTNTGEGTVAPSSVTFTPANWNAPQTVTVSGIDDAAVDGAQAYSITTSPATSADPLYDGLDPADVAATNVDDDSAGILIDPLTLAPSEGGTSTFTVVLMSQPTGDVTIDLSSSSPGEGSVSPASLTFTAANWNVPQTVTVTIPDDAIFDGPKSFSIVVAAAVSGDPDYDGLDGADVAVTASDDESTPMISISDAAAPAGGLATFTITLSVPSATPVTVNWATADGTGTAGTTYVAASGTVTFAPGETSATISVQTTSQAAPAATFFVNLSAPVGGTLGDAQGEAAIDAAAIPTLSFWMLLALACAIALVSTAKLHG